MTECTYCGKDCEHAEDLTVHLAEEHAREELSRIDRKRVDRYEEDGAGEWRQVVSTDGTAARYTRRGVLGAIAAGGLAGSGIAAGELTGSDVPGLANLVGNQEEKGEKDPGGETGPSSPQPASTPTVQNAGSGALLDVTFTNAGETGRKGPSQSDVNSEYSGTDLDGEVTVVGNGIQEWNVPNDGTYWITAYGAGGGGNNGGLGAKVAGNFELSEGDTLQILVGQTGEDFSSGGGGTFVAKGSNVGSSSPLLVAGGGAGEGQLNPEDLDEDGPRSFMNATVPGPGETASDGQPNDCGSGSGGTGGRGGTTPDGSLVAGAGGGFSGDGEDGSDFNSGGDAFQNGGVGGVATQGGADGGFGGGGGGFEGDESGAGGGYNGGAGGDWSDKTNSGCGPDNSMGGGGGSYNDGATPANEAEVNVGHGLVRIQRFTAIAVEGDNVTFSNTTVETGN